MPINKDLKIALKPCESSRIAEWGYDPESATLAIRFKSKASPMYYYDAVPQEVVDGIAKAPSIGKFFHEHIKGQFDFERISEPDKDEQEVAPSAPQGADLRAAPDLKPAP